MSIRLLVRCSSVAAVAAVAAMATVALWPELSDVPKYLVNSKDFWKCPYVDTFVKVLCSSAWPVVLDDQLHPLALLFSRMFMRCDALTCLVGPSDLPFPSLRFSDASTP